MNLFFLNSFFFNIDLLILEFVLLCTIFFLYVGIEKLFLTLKNFTTYLYLNLTFLYFFLFFIILIFSLNFFQVKFFSFFFQFYNDAFISLLKIFLFIFFIIFLFLLFIYLKNEKIFFSFEVYLLLLLSILSMSLLISSSELLALYLSLEMQSLIFYIIASSKQNSILSIEAGLKYFVLGTIASGFLLLGTSLFYGYTGFTKFFEINLFFVFSDFNNSFFLFFFLFFIFPFFFKFSVAPFHIWTPDVYEGSPTIVTFFFSILPKFIILGLLIRFFFDFFSLNFLEGNWRTLFFFCSFFSLILGSLGGIFQVKIKRLLAYSSITNVGFFLSSIFSLSIEGFISCLFYFFVYFLSTTGIFAVIISLRYFSNFLKLKNIFEYSSILNLNFFVVLSLLLNFFSLIGIPPLAGFFGKFFIFFSVLNKDFFFLIILLIIASILSGFFYLRVIRIIMFKRYLGFIFLKPLNTIVSYLLTLILFFNIFLIFYIDTFLKFLYSVYFFSFQNNLVFYFF
jgi:NADH-quinone oxidoreductase subunit N